MKEHRSGRLIYIPNLNAYFFCHTAALIGFKTQSAINTDQRRSSLFERHTVWKIVLSEGEINVPWILKLKKPFGKRTDPPPQMFWFFIKNGENKKKIMNEKELLIL